MFFSIASCLRALLIIPRARKLSLMVGLSIKPMWSMIATSGLNRSICLLTRAREILGSCTKLIRPSRSNASSTHLIVRRSSAPRFRSLILVPSILTRLEAMRSMSWRAVISMVKYCTRYPRFAILTARLTAKSVFPHPGRAQTAV